jgi:Raf kinase inhibitor-like YbhB/YbcL family protein
MKKTFTSLLLACAALQTTPGHAAGFEAGSTSIGQDGALAADNVIEAYGCHGPNLSPEVHWSGAPAGTKSFAVTVHDIDAPTDSGWWHWAVVDIPPKWKGVAKGGSASTAAAGALQLRNDFGSTGWGGLCPPAGAAPHRYVFKVFALPVPRLGIPADATPALASYMLRAQALATAQFVGTFGR